MNGQPPFQGNETAQLQDTSTFLLSTVTMIASAAGIVYYLEKIWAWQKFGRLLLLVIFAFLAVLTARTSYMASYINYDLAKEYMVYAHAAPAPKQVLAQVEDISRRTTGGLDISVAYDNDGLYPYWWYLRDYPNHRWFTDKPTRDLRESPLIISGDATMNKMEAIVKDEYIMFDYIRLWWPNQDYWNLTWDRLWYAISNRNMRSAIFDIWLNRDDTAYANLTNQATFTLENWSPASRMRFYIRKDVVGQIWNYGAAPVSTTEVIADPYETAIVPLQPETVLGGTGSGQGQFLEPRDVAAAPDGSIYITDSKNNRIVHLSPEGDWLQAWGTFADAALGSAPGGTFYEPWGIAVGPDGSVYVADTWNHRIQKFSPEGNFVTMWGIFGQAESPDAFWGPRGLAVDAQGNVFVTDTGNKRVVIFDANGEYISQFGTAGLEQGQFDEPVGLDVDPAGNVYVADTWNQRIQVFANNGSYNFSYKTSWDVYAWFGEALDNKPFLSLDINGNVFLVDPLANRLIQFDAQGNFVRGWNSTLTSTTERGNILSGIAFDNQGRLWLTDAGSNNVIQVLLP